ncbi:MAG: DUF1177 domain-containing protein [Xanthobacteraceae bacterium]|nr:DUF1177 domain-containing protein [Xanthobacteraceae bacterium]QYK45672.1 MAG: DUF1177 domain-containing protein [Xanthobacteraceae bacterium]
MALKQVIDSYELLDSAHIDGEKVRQFLESAGVENIAVKRISSATHHTDFIQIVCKGSDATAPKLGIIGKLGGIGARPTQIGIVSDADGAIAVVALALKITAMKKAGDQLPGDVILSTHICPAAPTRPHHPVPFMSSPVDRDTLCRAEIHPEMSAILSIDTSRGNRLVNAKGIAITPTVLDGYILPVSYDLVDVLERVTARHALTFPLSTQDITPYANNLFHINSIMQPAAYADVPVVGLAITAETAVPGCATGATQLDDIEAACRFSLEVAKAYGAKQCSFYDAKEFTLLKELYGSMAQLKAK